MDDTAEHNKMMEAINDIRGMVGLCQVELKGVASELVGINRNLGRINGAVSSNTATINEQGKEIARLQEAREWQKEAHRYEREDRVRADITTQQRLWDWVKQNGIQAGTLGGLIWVIIELMKR